MKIDKRIRRDLQKILIIGNQLIGDSVATLDLIYSISVFFDKAKLTLLGNGYSLNLYRQLPCIHQFIEIKDHNNPFHHHFHFGKWLTLIKKIKSHHFDLVLILPGGFEYAFFSFLTGIPHRIGSSSDLRTFLLTGSATSRTDRPNDNNYNELLKCFPFPIHLKKPTLNISKNISKNHHIPNKQYYCVSPCSTESFREWNEKSFISLLNFINQKYGIFPVLLGVKKETMKLKRIAIKTDGISLAGKTQLKDTISIIHKAVFFIGNDSGLAHISAFINTLTIVIYGPSNAILAKPIGKKVFQIMNEEILVPLHLRKKKKYRKICDINLLTPNHVWEKIQKTGAIKKALK